MSINIGMLIWKEMKIKSVSRDELALAVGITKHRVGTLLKSASIDTEMLKRISIKLGVNFFEYYRKDEELIRFEIDLVVQNHQELNQLKELIKEKNRLIQLSDETIKSQKKIIASLENLRKL